MNGGQNDGSKSVLYRDAHCNGLFHTSTLATEGRTLIRVPPDKLLGFERAPSLVGRSLLRGDAAAVDRQRVYRQWAWTSCVPGLLAWISWALTGVHLLLAWISWCY